jgi:hypothetical protein
MTNDHHIYYWYTPLDGSIKCKIKWHYCNYHLSNVSGLLSANGKQTMSLTYRDVREINLQHQEHG